MKKTLLLAALGLTMSACNPFAYQVIETSAPMLKSAERGHVYEDKDVEITYDFWNDDQQISFDIYNKTDHPIYLDMDRSHLILNGESLDYYQDSELTSAKVSSVTSYSYTSSNKVQQANQLAVRQKRIIQIPPNSFVMGGGKVLLSGKISDCDIRKVKSDPTSKSYAEKESPLTFRNYITYSQNADLSSSKVVDNSFYASKITLMTESSFKGKATSIKECPNDAFGIYGYQLPHKKPQSIYFRFPNR